MTRRHGVEEALEAWRVAERRLAAAGDSRERTLLELEVVNRREAYLLIAHARREEARRLVEAERRA
jgi:hypothetical protein